MNQFIAKLEQTLGDNEIILRLVLNNKFAEGYLSIFLEPEGNIEYLDAGATFELVLVLKKTKPTLRLDIERGGMNIMPDWYGAIFHNGKGIMNY